MTPSDSADGQRNSGRPRSDSPWQNKTTQHNTQKHETTAPGAGGPARAPRSSCAGRGAQSGPFRGASAAGEARGADPTLHRPPDAV